MDLNKLHKKIKPEEIEFYDWAEEQFLEDHNFYIGNVVLDNMFDDEPKRMRYCSMCRKWDIDNTTKIGETCHCMVCGAEGKAYSAIKKVNPTVKYQTMYSGQNLGDGIYLLRCYVVRFSQWSPLLKNEESNELEAFEFRRLYIGPNEYQREFESYDYSTHKTYWSTSGTDNCVQGGPVYPKAYERMKGTAAEYSFAEQAAVDLYVTEPMLRSGWSCGMYEFKQLSIWHYLCLYARDRKTEMLFKLGLNQIILDRMRRVCRIKCNHRAKNPYDYLRVYKHRLKEIAEASNQEAIIEVYQLERKQKAHYTPEEVKTLEEIIRIKGQKAVDEVLEFQTIKQLTNRLETYTKRIKISFHNVCIAYLDYYHIKKSVGFNMNNSIRLFPKDLKKAHLAAIEEQEMKQNEERLMRVDKTFTNIEKRFKKADKVYTYQDKNMIIRPAMRASEIVEEGRILHHCVGGDSYLKRHNTGQDIILFLRKTETPDVPYITVELDSKGYLVQWFGAQDEKPDEKKNDRWLKKYLKQLDPKKVTREMKGTAS